PQCILGAHPSTPVDCLLPTRGVRTRGRGRWGRGWRAREQRLDVLHLATEKRGRYAGNTIDRLDLPVAKGGITHFAVHETHLVVHSVPDLVKCSPVEVRRRIGPLWLGVVVHVDKLGRMNFPILVRPRRRIANSIAS